MEHLEGGELFARVKSKKRFSERGPLIGGPRLKWADGEDSALDIWEFQGPFGVSVTAAGPPGRRG